MAKRKATPPMDDRLTPEEVQALTDAKEGDTPAERFAALLKKATATPARKYRQKSGER